jgi:hypothetical protein
MKKESHFQWTEAAQKSFDALKKTEVVRQQRLIPILILIQWESFPEK